MKFLVYAILALGHELYENESDVTMVKSTVKVNSNDVKNKTEILYNPTPFYLSDSDVIFFVVSLAVSLMIYLIFTGIYTFYLFGGYKNARSVHFDYYAMMLFNTTFYFLHFILFTFFDIDKVPRDVTILFSFLYIAKHMFMAFVAAELFFGVGSIRTYLDQHIRKSAYIVLFVHFSVMFLIEIVTICGKLDFQMLTCFIMLILISFTATAPDRKEMPASILLGISSIMGNNVGPGYKYLESAFNSSFFIIGGTVASVSVFSCFFLSACSKGPIWAVSLSLIVELCFLVGAGTLLIVPSADLSGDPLYPPAPSIGSVQAVTVRAGVGNEETIQMMQMAANTHLTRFRSRVGERMRRRTRMVRRARQNL